MWSCPGNMPKYYLDKTTLLYKYQSLLLIINLMITYHFMAWPASLVRITTGLTGHTLLCPYWIKVLDNAVVF